jgi:hypothetical protein
MDLLKTVGLYLLLVVGGVFGFLALAPVFGYLPYSDRPGPGWFSRFPAVTWTAFWHGVTFALGWSLFLAPYALVCGVILFIVARVLERFHATRLVVAVVGALLAGFVSGYVVMGIGWYIAIAAPPVYAAMLLGIIYGAWLLPRRRVPIGPGV